jgi:hypothetical protein
VFPVPAFHQVIGGFTDHITIDNITFEFSGDVDFAEKDRVGPVINTQFSFQVDGGSKK